MTNSDDKLRAAYSIALAQQQHHWTAPSAAPQFLRLVENAVYVDGDIVFRVTEDNRRSAGQLYAELDFIAFLDGQGLTVAGPIRSGAGQLLHTSEEIAGYP